MVGTMRYPSFCLTTKAFNTVLSEVLSFGYKGENDTAHIGPKYGSHSMNEYI